MSKVAQPQLKRYLDKSMDFKLNGNRQISGILRGYDPFMNLVVGDAIEVRKDGNAHQLGIVVIRGNSLLGMEPRERI